MVAPIIAGIAGTIASEGAKALTKGKDDKSEKGGEKGGVSKDAALGQAMGMMNGNVEGAKGQLESQSAATANINAQVASAGNAIKGGSSNGENPVQDATFQPNVDPKA